MRTCNMTYPFVGGLILGIVCSCLISYGILFPCSMTLNMLNVFREALFTPACVYKHTRDESG